MRHDRLTPLKSSTGPLREGQAAVAHISQTKWFKPSKRINVIIADYSKHQVSELNCSHAQNIFDVLVSKKSKY